MKKTIFLFLAVAFTFVSCEKDNDRSGIFKGPETSVFHGKAWTWVQLNREGNPERVAISINDAALNSTTPGDGDAGGGDHHEDDNNNIVLPFHPKATVTPFKHAWLNWNANGHPPAGIYDVPHFDLHFYSVSAEERESFLDPAKLDASPAADYLPSNYIGVDPVPAMGKHFVDVTSPELNGQPFTQTFIYGSYDSKVVFYEPMITLDFLKNTNSFERIIPQPATFQKSGYYPAKMRVAKQNGITSIILEGFVYRQQS